MDTRWFYDFIALVEMGSFTQAAEYRNSSQAAFSRRIQSFEQWAGAKLIDRSVYPVELTPEGKKLYRNTLDMTGYLEDMRAELSPIKAHQPVRIALTYALATSHLAGWWRQWSDGQDIACITTVGNILEATSAFTSGSVDILISYSYPLLPPFKLDDGIYERLAIGTETLAPYASPKLLRQSRFGFPGTAEQPVPLLLYSRQSYFYKVVKHITDSAGQVLQYKTTFESEMSSTLSGAAQQGLGVAWLTDASVMQEGAHDLERLDTQYGDAWSGSIDVVAFLAQDNRRRPVRRIWEAIARESAAAPGG